MSAFTQALGLFLDSGELQIHITQKYISILKLGFPHQWLERGRAVEVDNIKNVALSPTFMSFIYQSLHTLSRHEHLDT